MWSGIPISFRIFHKFIIIPILGIFLEMFEPPGKPKYFYFLRIFNLDYREKKNLLMVHFILRLKVCSESTTFKSYLGLFPFPLFSVIILRSIHFMCVHSSCLFIDELYITICLSIHLLRTIFISSLGLSQIELQRTLVHMSLYEHMLSFLLGKYLGV